PPVAAAPTHAAPAAYDDMEPPSAELSERERLVQAMEKCGWVQAKAARILNLTPRQIGYALKKYGIEIQHL
ncbi:MAG: nif-specific transcriptional activator NifA, partial [Rhodospirillaceae bacterium]|nr:nif-specific transcriptional activator NifA [Rhodospirillales bacterium]